MLSWLRNYFMPTVDPLQELKAENNRLRAQLEKTSTPEQAALNRYQFLSEELTSRENRDEEENFSKAIEDLLKHAVTLAEIGPIAFNITEKIVSSVRVALEHQVKFMTLRGLYRELKRDQIRYECFSLPMPANFMEELERVREDLTEAAENMLGSATSLGQILVLLDKNTHRDLASKNMLVLIHQILDLPLPEELFQEDAAPAPAVVYMKPQQQEQDGQQPNEDEQESSNPSLRGSYAA